MVSLWEPRTPHSILNQSCPANGVHLTFSWNEVFEKDARVIVFLAKGSDGGWSHNVETQAYFARMHLVVNGDDAEGQPKIIKTTDLLEQLQ